MTVTFCAVCDYCILSSDLACPLCGWPTNSTPVVFGVEQVREIIGNIKHWEYQQHEGAMELATKVIKEYEDKVSYLTARIASLEWDN